MNSNRNERFRRLVSVVMPVYNVATWIDAAISSILKQTFTNFELVVVDDGSTDKSVEKIKKFNDPRIIIIQQQHRGLFHSLNLGIRHATGTWIARMDGDDISHPERLERQMNELRKNPDYVMCATFFGYISSNYRVVHRRDRQECQELSADLLTKGWQCADATVVFKRDDAISAGLYDVDIPINEKSLWYKILQKGKGICMGDCLYFVRIREGGSNIGKVGGAQRGWAARQRYDPYGFKNKYKGKAFPDLETIAFGGMQHRLPIYRTARDYRSIVKLIIDALRFRSCFKMVSLLLIAFTGDDYLKRALKPRRRKISEYTAYLPENKKVGDLLSQLGITHSWG